LRPPKIFVRQNQKFFPPFKGRVHKPGVQPPLFRVCQNGANFRPKLSSFWANPPNFSPPLT